MLLSDERIELEQNTQNIREYTPVHIACMNGKIEIVKKFMKYGITISVLDQRKSQIQNSITDSDLLSNPNTRQLTIDEIEPFCLNVFARKQAQSELQSQSQSQTETHTELYYICNTSESDALSLVLLRFFFFYFRYPQMKSSSIELSSRK